MPGSILVPLDGSPFGEHALPLAVTLARAARAELRLVHAHLPLSALPFAGSAPLDADWDRRRREEEARYLDAVAARLREELDVAARTGIVDGVVVEALERVTHEDGIDLVVMTTHGRGGVSRLWLGSVAEGLVRRSHLPILLVRPGEAEPAWSRPVRLRHILVPLAGPELSERILAPAATIARATGARLLLLRVVVPVEAVGEIAAGYGSLAPEPEVEAREAAAREQLGTLAGRLRADGLEADILIVRRTRVATAILEVAREREADMIAMATHGRSGVGRLLLGSVADKVLRGTALPVLLQRPDDA